MQCISFDFVTRGKHTIDWILAGISAPQGFGQLPKWAPGSPSSYKKETTRAP